MCSAIGSLVTHVVRHAASSKLSRSKLYAMAQGGEIPCSKVAGQWRFFRPEIAEWMLKQLLAWKSGAGADDGD